MILEEGVHNEERVESKNRSSHRSFHWENFRTSMEKPPIGVVADGTMESARSKDARDRSVHRVLEMPLVVHKARGGYRNYFHDQKIRGIQNFRNAVEKGRCSDLGEEDLRSVARLES